jgi:hypothetical protein
MSNDKFEQPDMSSSCYHHATTKFKYQTTSYLDSHGMRLH